jgi:hypothetical protein
VLVEYGDEGIESIIENAIDAIDRGSPRSRSQPAGVDAHIGGLHRTHDVAHADLLRRPSEPDATVPSALRCDQVCTRKKMYDLEDILHRQLQPFGQIGDFHQSSIGPCTFDQDSDGVTGRFIQSHVRVPGGCWVASSF